MTGTFVPGGGEVSGAKHSPRIPRKIILVGPDCSGKTTIAEMLAKHYGCTKYAHSRIPDDLEKMIYTLEFVRDKFRAPYDIVVDQFPYPVDIVYSDALFQELSPIELIGKQVMRELIEHHVLIVFVNAPAETLRQRYKIRGDELWDITQILRVKGRYELFFKRSAILQGQYIQIDTTKHTSRDMINLIEDWYKKWEAKV